MKEEKQVIRDFYDKFGWHKNEDGVYRDVAAFVDTRPVLDAYRHQTHARVKQFLNPQGKYYLDAGSGAVAHPEHLAYSTDYTWRVSIDLSVKALREAREKIQDRGFYVQADITQLPFKKNVFDAIVFAHVLYHIPREEQQFAVHELHRSLREGGRFVLIYAWNTAPSRFAGKIVRAIRSLLHTHPQSKTGKPNDDRPPIYSYHHGYGWFRKILPKSWNWRVACWRSVDRVFTGLMVPDNGLGKWIINRIYVLEERFPALMGRIGRYPIIIIEK